jgi:hypothetical protein
VAWRSRGWPDELLDRSTRSHVPLARVRRWVRNERWTPDRVRQALERLESGSLRVREATWEDNAALVDLYAHAPEDVGPHEVTVERAPFAFAQFSLQEAARVVVESDGVLLAAIAESARLSVVQAREVTVHIPSSYRVREGFRGEGLGPLVQKLTMRPRAGGGMYYYRRRAGKKHRLLARVGCYAAVSSSGGASGVRLARQEDVETCVTLINRTHAGLDLFRPYDAAYLSVKLDAARTPVPVYDWSDYFVVEEEGQIIACGGLWDRGRHLRERWLDKRTGERWLVENTALLDFGFADRRDDAMARLIGHFITRTGALGRTHLMAPLEFLPSVAERLAGCHAVQDKRALYWHPDPSSRRDGAAALSRPYTDLAYW